MICGQCSVVNTQSADAEAATLKCKRWACDTCAAINRRRLIRMARTGEPSLFITLTSNPAVGNSPEERAHMLIRAWRLIVRRAKRKFGMKKLPYLVVIEATKRGEPHLHILTRLRFLPQQWLSEQMEELTNAKICWVETVDGPARIANYLGKYLGKDPHKFDGCKRYWSSQDWIVDREAWEEQEKRGGSAWRINGKPLKQIERDLLQAGWFVEWTRPDFLRAQYGGDRGPEPKPADWMRAL